MHFCLVGIKGPFQGSTVVLQARAGIGRDVSNELQIIDDPLVSREHATISVTAAGGHCIQDTFSHNGTYVNGKRVRACQLTDADRIDIGASAFLFRALTDAEFARQDEARILHVASGPAQDLTIARAPRRPGPAAQP